jgi:hypothetical protein
MQASRASGFLSLLDFCALRPQRPPADAKEPAEMNAKREKDIKSAFTALMPLAPFVDADPIRERAARAALRDLHPETAVWLAAVAHIRHRYTDYDALLDEGYDRDSARHFVIDAINAKLTQWRSGRFLDDEDDWPEM